MCPEFPKQDPAWSIAPPSAIQYLQNLKNSNRLLPAGAQFSMFRDAIRSEAEIAELVAATGTKFVSDLVTYKPSTLAFFETVAMVTVEIQMPNEANLKPIALHIYNNYIKNELEKVEQDLQNKIQAEALQWAYASLQSTEIFDTIKAREKNGQYKPGEYFSGIKTAEDAILKVIQDKKYNELMLKAVNEIIEPLINKAIDNNELSSLSFPLKRFTLHNGEDRHTFMFAGAPACGKGTAIGIMEERARQSGIEWDDIIKNNTDTYRNIVANTATLGADATIHTELNNDEAYYIYTRVDARFKQKLAAGAAPHLLIDGVYPSKDRLTLGIRDDGQLHVAVVTAPVELSVDRAYKRGLETGRYCSTSYIVEAHQAVSKDFHSNIADFVGKNLDYAIYDTNVPIDTLPSLIERGDLKEKKIEILDYRKVSEFYGKKDINQNAKNPAELYPNNVKRLSIEYVQTMQQAGVCVKKSTDELYYTSVLNSNNETQKPVVSQFNRFIQKSPPNPKQMTDPTQEAAKGKSSSYQPPRLTPDVD